MSLRFPSPAITVSSHQTIEQTIRVMRDHDVGSVLVTDYSEPHRLVGIFTERDLLKWVLDLKKGDSWELSIANIMTKNPTTLDLLDMDQAPELMAKMGRRHVPVTYSGENGEALLAGVISMRDCFLQLLEERNQRGESEIENRLSKFTIGVLAKNEKDQALQLSILSDHHHAQVLPEGSSNKSIECDLLIFDLDHFPAAVWSQKLKTILDHPNHPNVIVVYHPGSHHKAELDAIHSLAQGKVIYTFLKPIAILDYLNLIRGMAKGPRTI